MKSRILLYLAIGLFILGTAWFIFSKRGYGPGQVLPATINRDCAPWDGAAFTVKIPASAGAMISASIYQSPEIALPVTFSFPDETGRTGNALVLLPVGEPAELSGKVSFQGIEPGTPVDGRFDLLSETGQVFQGKFRADWGNEIVMCG
ncbi:MAG TPA: hypothetical protein VK249_31645 [Anaerolineales bacterium]|nr:hypothetical protein [Anaerolineales bacterium]